MSNKKTTSSSIIKNMPDHGGMKQLNEKMKCIFNTATKNTRQRTELRQYTIEIPPNLAGKIFKMI